MALPFLPAQHIQSMFVRTESLVLPNGKMCKLINYVCQPWIKHPVFVPHCWTVYIQHHSLFQPLQVGAILAHFLTVYGIYTIFSDS